MAPHLQKEAVYLLLCLREANFMETARMERALEHSARGWHQSTRLGRYPRPLNDNPLYGLDVCISGIAIC